MKKFLLSLALVLGLGSYALAADLVEDFTVTNDADHWDPTLPTAADASNEATYTSKTTNVVYGLKNVKYVSNSYGTYLFPQKGGYVTMTLPIDCKAIVVHTSSGASTKAVVTLYADTTKIEEKALDTQNADFTYAIPSENRAKGTVYKFSVSSAANAQFTKITYKEVSSDPEIVLKGQASQTTAIGKGGSVTLNLGLSGENLTEAIAVTSSSANFSLSSSSIAVADIAKGVDVTYTSSTPGTETGTITFTSGAATASYTLTAITAEHAGTETDPLTVADVIAMKSSTGSATEFYVKGTIIGAMNNSALMTEASGTVSFPNSNLCLADAAGETTTYVPVFLPSGSTRSALNLAENPDNKGKEVVITGTLETYFSMDGIKNATYVSGLTATVSDYADIKAWIEAAPTGLKEGRITGNVSVVYQSNKYLYIKDATASLLVYGELANTYANGDVLTGITGTYQKTSAGITELIPVADTFGTATAGTAVEPEAYDIEELSDGDINKYVSFTADKIEADSTDESGKTFIATVGTATLTLYNQFAVTLAAAQNVTVKGIVSKYNNKLQLYVVEAKAAESGVGNVVVDSENALVEYFNLQGVRVANPTQGLFIKRQGNKVQKVVIK
jgi:hypothetical protein